MGGRWEFPGGKAEPGESPEEALKREIFEEFSVSVRVGGFLVSTTFHHGGAEYRLYAFEAFLDSFELVLAEHEEVRWLSFGDISAFDLADSDRRVYELLRQIIVPG